jgi:hypothetical protein
MNMPKELGGSGMTMFQQALVSEQLGGRRTPSGGSCTRRPRGRRAVVSDHQMETWIKPTIRGETHECYAITEEGAGSDVDAIAATARRDGDDYVLNGVKMHVTSFNGAGYCFFQGKIADGTARGRARDVLRPCRHARRARRAHARVLAHVRRPPSARRVRGRARAGREPDRPRRATASPSRTSGSATSG